MNWLFWLFRRLFLDNWKHIDAECAELAAQSKRKWDFRPLVVLVTVCVSLTLQDYIGQGNKFYDYFPEQVTGYWGEMKRFAWWSGWRFFGYVVLPMITIVLMPGERLRDYFISLRNLRRHIPIYVALYLLVLPAVVIASRTEVFYLTYPFYKWSNRSTLDLLIWEALYALQFLSLEFFFRGYILNALRARCGSAAIFVMVVPYCMIHYGKPMAETFGAIGAGIILGTLALRTRSIWGGVFIHIGVALTMDMLALGHCPPADANLPCPSRQ
jgi:membrane protease YdiL (CAAX protease family)